ncbi:HTH-type transcriptional regulator/antitoxin HigA [Herbaspirillum sp. Sphag1AN]|uniref:helix-turn-helix domain-containing protein n=1 Tax=unclassified Herbaspirillum TaxID=2624150 RepID=UPI00161015E9|nr:MULTISPECIES: transcriptional regulator [unclassified Herbaspirillum]MBB3213409.1 HTH-type transcriptional regulator/antitoxin HigA [Herbaspirillum sp. Sphag1AN]MBB3246547.1 HTH-type transcriptional regulator/antitoxin HigA [Herbaspirillum sp. Sphag64]
MEALIEKRVIEDVTTHFVALSSVIPLSAIRSEGDYNNAVSSLNQLLDIGAGEENHALANLVDILGTLIGEYEDQNYPPKSVTPADALRFLMDEHRLSQSDLPEIGSQGVVSEILNGKRELNTRQIRELSARFSVGTSVFF